MSSTAQSPMSLTKEKAIATEETATPTKGRVTRTKDKAASSKEKSTPTKEKGTQTKEKATPTKEKGTPAKEKAAANSGEKENFTLLLAAIGPDLVGNAAYKTMAALNPDGRTASAWEHYFRSIKAKAKEIKKEYEGDEDVSALVFFLSWLGLVR